MRAYILAVSLLLASSTVAQDGSIDAWPTPPIQPHSPPPLPLPPILKLKTSSGTYTGLINSTTPDIRQWLSIPYIKPLVRALGFIPPKKASNYGATDLKTYKPIYYQNSGSK